MRDHDTLSIRQLEAVCIIGALPHERTTPQRVVISLDLTCDVSRAGESDALEDTVDYAAVAQEVIQIACASHCRLIERLASLLAAHCLRKPGVTGVTVRIDKPEALPGRAIAAVSITRRRT
jgi:dihydroneopterin aldolase